MQKKLSSESHFYSYPEKGFVNFLDKKVLYFDRN